MGFLVIQGDARHIPLPSGVAQCCVTSPPYFALRDYGTSGQIGLEETADDYLAAMIGVFREVRRILRRDGTLWLNIGDSMEDKNLMGIPWRLALALKADGWHLRSEIIWHKPNPMPEAVTDRPSRCHEHLFLLAKSARYFFDAEAVREPGTRYAWTAPQFKGGDITKHHGNENGGGGSPLDPEAGRNVRSVWSVATESFPGSHFATFPKKLVTPCIKAGTSEKGCCPACRSPWVRIVEKERIPTRPGNGSKVYVDPDGSPYSEHHGMIVGNRDPLRHCTATKTKGWEPSCRCGQWACDTCCMVISDQRPCPNCGKMMAFRPYDPVPCLVFDPFGGAFTTAVVADGLGRIGIGTELNREYCEMGLRRLEHPHAKVQRPHRQEEPLPLFAVPD